MERHLFFLRAVKIRDCHTHVELLGHPRLEVFDQINITVLEWRNIHHL
jgi:hypothetical protein